MQLGAPTRFAVPSAARSTRVSRRDPVRGAEHPRIPARRDARGLRNETATPRQRLIDVTVYRNEPRRRGACTWPEPVAVCTVLRRALLRTETYLGISSFVLLFHCFLLLAEIAYRERSETRSYIYYTT